jgi:uncharacterized repeat protein (TIGR03803 family)
MGRSAGMLGLCDGPSERSSEPVNLKRIPMRPWLLILLLALAPISSAEWKEKVLYSFQGGADSGSVPAGGVVFDNEGNLYGVTSDGGGVYQLAPPVKQGGAWTETVLYVFKGNTKGDGATPEGGLVIDTAGNLYGTTAYGGTGNCVLLGTSVGCGTVYELSSPKQKGGAWTETILYSFPTAKQGYFPWGNLVFDDAGNLYGATDFGGGKGTTCDPYYQYCGTVFELSPPKTKGGKWTQKILHSFAGGSDGANPNGGLVLDSKGNVYGTTFGGGNESGECGSLGCGTAFDLKPPSQKGGAWTEKMLYRFSVQDGAAPAAGVVFGGNGDLYGTTEGGGTNGSGVVFELAAPTGGRGSWKEAVLYRFNDGNDGANPAAGLVFDAHGDLYGTAYRGQGGSQYGDVFRLKPPSTKQEPWTLRVLHGFSGRLDAAQPNASLVFDRAGNLYGTSPLGGTGTGCGYGACGTVYEVSP